MQRVKKSTCLNSVDAEQQMVVCPHQHYFGMWKSQASRHHVSFFTPKLGTENKTSYHRVSYYIAKTSRPSTVPNDSQYTIFKQCKVNSVCIQIRGVRITLFTLSSGKSIQTLNPILNCHTEFLWAPLFLLCSV